MIIVGLYIRLFHQVQYFIQFVETFVRCKEADEEVALKLIMMEDEIKDDQQLGNIDRITDGCDTGRIKFDWEIDQTASFHAQYIVMDTRWNITRPGA